jgi:hypothetical protein
LGRNSRREDLVGLGRSGWAGLAWLGWALLGWTGWEVFSLFLLKLFSFIISCLVLNPFSNRFLEQKISKEKYFNLRQKERD